MSKCETPSSGGEPGSRPTPPDESRQGLLTGLGTVACVLDQRGLASCAGIVRKAANALTLRDPPAAHSGWPDGWMTGYEQGWQAGRDEARIQAAGVPRQDGHRSTIADLPSLSIPRHERPL